jgi:demethylmenaquinone methyltransferase/2-methoxy-6-polyprenyl-1,4-benzoquinol methylase
LNSNRRLTRANYDRLSRWYDFISGSSERPARARGVQKLNIQAGECVLEIGFGTGDALEMCASAAGRDGWVVGVDLSAGMLRVARSKVAMRAFSNVTFVQGDGVCLAFDTGSFDVVFMSFTLELFSVEDISALLAECRRVLKPGGRIGIVSLMQKDTPNWIEILYAWAHRRWPAVIDCRPIPLIEEAQNAGLAIPYAAEMSMWGLAVGILIGLRE